MGRLDHTMRRWTALVVVMGSLVLASVSFGAGVQRVDLQQARNRAQALFEEKQVAAALAIFVEIAEAPEATADDWLNVALSRYEMAATSDSDEAMLQALAAADSLRPDDPAVHYLRGLLYARQVDNARASESFALAAQADPTDPATLYNWGAVLQDAGRVEEALAIYERVAAMGFDVAQQFYSSAVYRAGQALAVRDGREAAIPYLERWRMVQGRLSQAQRAPSALEAGRYKRVVVPRANLVAATPESIDRIALQAWAVATTLTMAPANVALGEVAGGMAVLTPGSGDAAGPGFLRLPAPPGPVAVGDYDRDGVEEVLVLAPAATLLLRPRASDGTFELVPASGIPVVPTARQASWVDADHDGDLDLIIATAEANGGVRWIANHGGGEFVEMTDAGLGGPAARQIVWADFDDDSDIDFFVLRSDGTSSLYSNAREGRFEEIAVAVGADAPPGTRGVVAADVDNDGWFDLVLATGAGAEVRANKGDGTFRSAALAGPALETLHAGDLNNDGWLDLVGGGGEVLVNSGEFRFVPGALDGLPLDGTVEILAIADENGDGALDLLARSDTRIGWWRQREPVANWLRVSLAGVKNNSGGIGTSVEAKAGGLYQRRLQRAGWSHFGLSNAPQADVVRITWPNGIIQNETNVAANASLGPVGEVERLEGSCPLLYTWNGTEWVFINEVLGVAPLGMPLATGVIHPPDFDEYVFVPGEALRSRDGQFEIRLTEELREAGYLDTVRLIALDRPANARVVPDERFVPPPHPEFALYATVREFAVTATDGGGRDWTAELAAVDGDRARPFAPHLYEGLATEHHLVLSLPEARAGDDVRLLLTGWVYWATGSVNLQVDQDPRVRFAPVQLEVPDGRGGWRVAIEDIGLPNGKNSTLVVELGQHLRPGDPRVRLSTTMRLYWDAATYAVGADATRYVPEGDWQGDWRVPRSGLLRLAAAGPEAAMAPRLHVLEPRGAAIRWRGFSELVRDPDGFETFEYSRVSPQSNWNQHRGDYTRYGAVDELVGAADDRLVIIGTGDEVSIRFDDDLPPVPDGWERDWLVYLNGWVKDGDPHTLGGDRVGPLPFHAMGAYPYAGPDPESLAPGGVAWRARYNTRPARLVNPPLRPRR